ncbi:MAG TPA: hypothetical protein VFQ46_08655 [Candidatus Limnocylindria bacterium]|nr:hypothetical protein [Candidatus Limnocylindria bacterium]
MAVTALLILVSLVGIVGGFALLARRLLGCSSGWSACCWPGWSGSTSA